jgi:hypothetical protein
MGALLCRLRPGFEGLGVAGDEGAAVALHMGERPEPVRLGLEDPVRVIEGSAMRSQDPTPTPFGAWLGNDHPLAL